jgi:membrane protein DedA with SNARE-associated domain
MIEGSFGLERFLIAHGPAAVIAGAALEGDMTLILAGVIAHIGIFSFPTAIAAGALGTYIADLFWFLVGKWRGPTIRTTRLYGHVGPKVERWARRFGPIQLVASRFIYGTRIASMVFWGLAGLPLIRFLLIDLLGAILGAVVFGALGWGLSGSITVLVGHIRRIEMVLLVALIAGGVIVLWLRRAADAEADATAEGE